MTLGGVLLAVGAVAGFIIGRAASDPGGIQARATVRELQKDRQQRQRQLAAARDAVSRVVTDPRTHAHTRLELENRVSPLLVERVRA